MPADPKDLETRIAAASPSDTSRGLNYNAAFRLVREMLGEQAVKECDPLGKGSRIDFLSYPIAEYLRLAWAVVDRLERSLGGVEAAFFRLGERTIEDHLGSVLGRTMYAIAGRDVRRMLTNLPWSYRATVSYGERRVEWLEEKRVRVVFRRDFLVPAFHCGVIQSGIGRVGAVNPRVTGRPMGFLDAEYEVVWD